MKSIQVDNIYFEKSYYKIRLGTGTIHMFKSERNARKFQTQLNKYLSTLALNYNQIFSDLYQLYRELWPLFYTHNKTARGCFFQSENTIKEEFTKIENLLDLLTTHTSRQNNFLRVYRDFELIHESIQIIHHSINSVICKKNIQFIIHRLNIILHQSTNNIKDLTEYSNHARNHPIDFDRTTAALMYSLTYSQSA